MINKSRLVLYDLNTYIENNDVLSIKKIIKELKEILHEGRKLSKSDQAIVHNYYKIVSQYERYVFENKLECDVINDNIEDTLPYHLGYLKGYCSMLLDK